MLLQRALFLKNNFFCFSAKKKVKPLRYVTNK